VRVSVVGTGYVGLVSGVCLAEVGHEVVCVDLDAEKVARIMRGEPPIFEEGLEKLLRRNVGRRFRATTDLREAVLGTELTLIAVGTPLAGDAIDLSYVRAAASQVGEALTAKPGPHSVVVKSTVVPGTTDTVVRAAVEEASRRRAGDGFGLGMNPEFLTEGQAVHDFLHPDRIVLGALDERTMGRLETLYAPFRGVPLIRTNPRTAEMIKYVSNALLATAISFSNEVANLCAALGGVDALDVMRGVHASAYLTVAGADGRRATAPLASFLLAGCGFGGSCLPKDVAALAAHGEAHGAPMPLLRAVLAVNRDQPGQILRILEEELGHLPRQVGVLGLAFKPDTDDVRESPSLEVIRLLRARGVRVKAWDPVAIPQARRVLGRDVTYADRLEDCLHGVEAVVLLTRWKHFDAVPELLQALPRPPLLVDGRRQLAGDAVPRYAGVGL
jgi:UDPglucose 6-dehydrogenase/GDP-mannose 6-dehydrogenase